MWHWSLLIFSHTTPNFIQTQGSGCLTHYHTKPHFDALKIHSCGKHCEKRRNCLLQAISPFRTMFSTLYGTYFSFQMHFKMSAICVNLDQSKILLSGNGLVEVQTFWERKKMLLNQVFPRPKMFSPLPKTSLSFGLHLIYHLQTISILI